MGTAKKAKMHRIYIGISTKICSRSAHILPKEFSARCTAVVASNCGAPRAHKQRKMDAGGTQDIYAGL